MPDPADIAAFRFGFGLPLPHGARVDAVGMMAALAAPDREARRWPAPDPGAVIELQGEAHASRDAQSRARRLDGDGVAFEAARERYKAALAALEAQWMQAEQARLARALESRDPFRERLVWFWADHFTTVAKFQYDRAMPLSMVETAIRPYVAARFPAMLRAVVMHPAMLKYLDQVASIGPGSTEGQRRGRGLNENLARELIELHTMGVGAGYSQADVRELAELLTGLTAAPGEGAVFRHDWAEPGPEHVLGKTYPGKGLAPIHAVLEDLALRPETARHLARKLAVHFLADQPPEDVVEAMADAYRQSRGDLRAVYGALLDHPAAFALPLSKARRPDDFLVSALRALGVTGDQVMTMGRGAFLKRIVGPLKAMGQDLAGPIGPDGWAEATEAWITPQGLAARIAWAMEVPGRLSPAGVPDPRLMVERALGSLATDAVRLAAARAETQREGVGLVLASPAFNRR